VVPFGARIRSHGRKSFWSVISPMWTAMRSPVFALNVHVSISPAPAMVPQWVPPLINAPPPAPQGAIVLAMVAMPARSSWMWIALISTPASAGSV
jgi:hypothetical protein